MQTSLICHLLYSTLLYIACVWLLQSTNFCHLQWTGVSVPVKRRYTGTFVDRRSLTATPWKLRVLHMEPVPTDDIPALVDFQVSAL